MANWAYGLSQGIAAGAQSAGGLIDAQLKEEADQRAADRRLSDQERLLAAQEAMQERIAEASYQRQQRPNQAAGALLTEAGQQQLPAKPEYGNNTRVNLSGSPEEVEAKINAIRNDPNQTADSRELVAAYDAQKQAESDSVGKTRAPTREEQIQIALDNAIKRGDAASYERLKLLAGDKYTPIPEGGLLNTTTGEMVGGGTSKADREREKDDRQFENRRKLQEMEDDRKDQRALSVADAAIRRDEEKAARKKLEPLPTAALKQRQTELDAIGSSSAIQSNISNYLKKIDDGELKFGLIGNYVNEGMNWAGASSKESLNYSNFRSDMEKLRNDSLRLNAGVQTDGDAQRAWYELFNGINDTDIVRSRLERIKGYNQEAVKIRKNNVDLIQANYNRDPFDFTPFEHPSDKRTMPNNTQPVAPQLPSGWSVKVK